MIDVPETQHRLPRERGRLHGLGAPGVRLARADMFALAVKILERAR